MIGEERPDPMLGRPLTPKERAALNELWRQIRLSREAREAHPIVAAVDAKPIPLSPEERRALLVLAYLRERGFLGPT